MKFNKGKFQILHLRQNNPGCVYRVGNERLESSAVERDLGVLIDGKLNMSQQCALVARRAIHVLGSIRHSIAIWAKEGVVLLCSALVQTHLESWRQFWAPQYKKDIKLLESIQRRAMKVVKGLVGKSYDEWLRALDLFSLEKKRLRGDLTAICNFLMRGSSGAGTDLFTLMTSDMTQGNSIKLSQERFCLDFRKRFFPQRVVGHLNRLSREVVAAPSLTEFKKCLDNTLRHMV
ncbi:hypothetical protein HGM15179_021102 [Zosterops borbonicus]|uniref:Uncharacterized protein n=1 Tax=Zosterops borbonicus TaxID=364589 RepID=A0A8K1FY66_9PASS|nr:hypothetical protein HGM15179_021102 [Zosterops borbonicus]